MVQAQLPSTQRGVGYVAGDDIDTEDMYIGKADTYPVGTLLTPSVLSSYAGCKVVGIRFAVSQNMSGSRVFLYKVENNSIGDPMLSQSVRRASAGWNDIYFNNNYTYDLTGEETLLVGFNYVETEEMVEAEKGALCTAKNEVSNGFLLYTTYNNREGWYSMESYGNICVQLIVDITSLPGKDIDFTTLLIGPRYKKKDNIIDLFALYSNVGRDSISTYSLAYQIDGRTPVVKDFEGMFESGSWEVEIPIPEDLAIGEHSFRVYVNSIDGEPALATRNDTLTTSFCLYAHPLKRQKHYVEQYVHYQSPYVPYLSRDLDPLAAKDTTMVLVNVSAVGNPLAVNKAANYEKLYAYTYPSFTIDRFYFYGERYIAFDVNDYVTIMPGFAAEAIKDLLYEADGNPSFATVDILPQYDAQSRRLQLEITGDVSEDALPVFGELGLTLMLTEDSVVDMQAVYNEQAQRTEWDYEYVHNHVLRHVLTASAGDRLTVENGRFTASYETTLSDDWQPENMTVVAFVTKYSDKVTDENVMSMDITNCNSVALRNVVTGIGSLTPSLSQGEGAVYDLAGRQIVKSFNRQLRKGLYIIGGKKIVK